MAQRQTRVRDISQQAAVYGSVGLLTLFLLFPFLWMLSTSLKPAETIFSSPPQWIPWPPTFCPLLYKHFGRCGRNNGSDRGDFHTGGLRDFTV